MKNEGESELCDAPLSSSANEGSFVAQWRHVFKIIGSIPFAFLGVGMYRAWLATFFRYEAFPTIGFADYAVFEGAIAVVSFALAFSARRIVPLWSNRTATRISDVVAAFEHIFGEEFGRILDALAFLDPVVRGGHLAAGEGSRSAAHAELL